MKVRFYKVTVILNGIETVLYIPTSGQNNLTLILKAFKLPIVKIEFLGWHIVNIFAALKMGSISLQILMKNPFFIRKTN